MFVSISPNTLGAVGLLTSSTCRLTNPSGVCADTNARSPRIAMARPKNGVLEDPITSAPLGFVTSTAERPNASDAMNATSPEIATSFAVPIPGMKPISVGSEEGVALAVAPEEVFCALSMAQTR
jgi:hypothetical protein